MEYLVIRRAEDDFILKASLLHHKALSYRSFITAFGLPFLERFYQEVLRSGIGFLVVAHEGAQLRGFILGTTNSASLPSVIIRRFNVFFLLILRRIICNSNAILKLFQTLFYFQKSNENIPAELAVIVVDETMRSKGIGKHLVGLLDEEFKRHGIERYKVTVHQEMKEANNFYMKYGMKLHRTFRLYGVDWNMWRRDITSIPDHGAKE